MGAGDNICTDREQGLGGVREPPPARPHGPSRPASCGEAKSCPLTTELTQTKGPFIKPAPKAPASGAGKQGGIPTGKPAEQTISNFREFKDDKSTFEYTLGAFQDLKTNDLKTATWF